MSNKTAFFTRIASHKHPMQLSDLQVNRRFNVPEALPALTNVLSTAGSGAPELRRRPTAGDGGTAGTSPEVTHTVALTHAALGNFTLLSVGHGVDDYSFQVPSNLRYAGCTLITVPPSSTSATITALEQPDPGHTGNGQIRARWTCPPGGQIRYRLRAYAEPIPDPVQAPETQSAEEIHIVNQQSVQRLQSALQSQRAVRVIFSGPEAAALNASGAFGNNTPWGGGVSYAAVETSVLIVGILAAAGVSALGIAAVTAIIIYGIQQGYTLDVTYEGGTFWPPQAPKMIFDLVPPSS